MPFYTHPQAGQDIREAAKLSASELENLSVDEAG